MIRLLITLLVATTLQSSVLALDLSPVEFNSKEQEPNIITKEALENEIESVQAIITTRPTFTDSWLAIPKGSFQVESGITYTDLNNKTTNLFGPEILLKLGIAKDVELRASLPNFSSTNNQAINQDSLNFSDISLGLSFHRAIKKSNIDIAIIPIINLPTGANNISSNAIDPELRVVIAKTVNPKLVIASQLAGRWYNSAQSTNEVIFNPTLISYYNFTPKICTFLEYASLIPTTGGTQHYLQTGLLYLPKPRHQFDIRFGKGLNSEASDLFLGIGYSFRVDNLFK